LIALIIDTHPAGRRQTPDDSSCRPSSVVRRQIGTIRKTSLFRDRPARRAAKHWQPSIGSNSWMQATPQDGSPRGSTPPAISGSISSSRCQTTRARPGHFGSRGNARENLAMNERRGWPATLRMPEAEPG